MKRQKSQHQTTTVRRESIIKAALELFVEKGFTNTSMADICTRAGASVGSVYHHFENKEKLAASVYLEGIRQYQAGLVSGLNEKADVETGIRSVVSYHLTWVKDNPGWAQFLFFKRHESYMDEANEDLLALNRSFAEGMSLWFSSHMDNGSIRRMNRDVLLSLLLGPCQNYVWLYLSGKATTSIESAIDEISAAVYRGLAQIAR